jgi:hypothetical protein
MWSRGACCLVAACLVLATLASAGCGSSSSVGHTTSTFPSYDKLPPSTQSVTCNTPNSNAEDLHIWSSNSVMVGLASPEMTVGGPLGPGTVASAKDQIAIAVSRILPLTLKDPVTRSNPIMRVRVEVWGDGLGAAIVSVAPACLHEVVDSINSWIIDQHGIAFTTNSPFPRYSIEFTGASPDWYIIGSEGGAGIGGSPGGDPHSQPGATRHPPAGGGSGTMVYVLDTADQLGQGTLGMPPSPVRYPLLCGSDPQTVDPNSACAQELTDLAMTTTLSHLPVAGEDDYGVNAPGDTEEREHGLFVSDLIHHLAPQAQIQLLRTLNDHGYGDVVGLMERLGVVLSDSPPSGTIVNMSLSTVLSTSCLLDVWKKWESTYAVESASRTLTCTTGIDAASASHALVGQSSLLQFSQLNLLVQALSSHGVVVVAAAGTRSQGSADGYAGLPAGYCGVTAVAAAQDLVGSNWQVKGAKSDPLLAAFSNQPYLTGRNCLQIDPASRIVDPLSKNQVVKPPVPTLQATPAGDAVAALGVGVCSLYANDTDPSTPKAPPAGYVQWDGTSFATALISGNLAARGSKVPTSLDESQPCQ